MAICPRCGTALKDEYGMSQCPSCGAFSFVQMDGEAIMQDSTSDSEPEFGTTELPDPIEGVFDTSAHESTHHNHDDGMVLSEAVSRVDTAEVVETFSATEAVDSFGATEAVDFFAQNSELSEPRGFGPADDPLNLNEFANSEVSSAKDGPLLLRILISGIDTKEIRESIREVLQDPRFAWNSNEIFSKVSKGHLAIQDVSPVKASIFISRIKRLPVQIRWEQYAITQGQG